MAKKTVEQEINDFMDCLGNTGLTSMLEHSWPLVDLYYVSEDKDWVKDEVGEELNKQIRIIRTVYLFSKFADLNAGKMAEIKMRFKDLWQRMEKQAEFEEVGKNSTPELP